MDFVSGMVHNGADIAVHMGVQGGAPPPPLKIFLIAMLMQGPQKCREHGGVGAVGGGCEAGVRKKVRHLSSWRLQKNCLQRK